MFMKFTGQNNGGTACPELLEHNEDMRNALNYK